MLIAVLGERTQWQSRKWGYRVREVENWIKEKIQRPNRRTLPIRNEA